MLKQTQDGSYLEARKRISFSLGSKLISLFIMLMLFVFYAFNIFQHSYPVHISGGGEVIKTDYYTGYSAFSVPFFKSYAVFFLVLSMMVSVAFICLILIEIFSLKDMHGPTLILLGLETLSLEFLLRSFSLGGYFLFFFSVLNWIQYFIFIPKRKEIDLWSFIGMMLLDIALLPSALASSSLFLN